MLPGYNHNVCYKGQTFHIQTEDSGVQYPHIITLLFVKGNIIARKKKEYGDILNYDRLETAVRELMQTQHKEMLRELKTGRYDAYLAGAPTREDVQVCAQPEPAKAPAPPPITAPKPPAPAARPPAPPATPAPAAKPATPAPAKPAVPPPARPAAPAAPAPARPAAPAPPAPPLTAGRPAAPPAPVPPAAPLTAGRPAAPPAPAKPVAPAPPRPAPPVAVAPPPPPPARLEPEEVITEKPASKTITLSDDEDLRDEDIFGADLISDRSLDEVILNFLSKQMDEDED